MKVLFDVVLETLPKWSREFERSPYLFTIEFRGDCINFKDEISVSNSSRCSR